LTIFWLGLSWLIGIALSAASKLVTWQWLILAAAALAGGIGFRQRASWRGLFLLILFLCLGAARFQFSQRPWGENHISRYNDAGVLTVITGRVIAPPDVRDSYAGLNIEVEKMRIADGGRYFSVEGRILGRATRFADFSYGDRVVVKGYLETPPEFETFSYRDYLARQGIHSLVYNADVRRTGASQGSLLTRWLYAFRQRALVTIEALFPEPEASLLAGILVGMERWISAEVRQDFNATGTTHIIAISGFNITIIAALFTNLFRRLLGIRRGMILAGLAIGLYTLLVGADAAVVRAAIMGCLVLLARLLGRPTHGLASLAVAAILMTAIDPDALWDVGFQLSFAATLGLMLYSPPLEGRFIRLLTRWIDKEKVKRIAAPVSEFVLFTFAAQITTLPVSMLYFQRLPLLSILANPVILPAQPALMISGGIATLLGMIWIPLGQPLAWIAWIFPAFTIRAVSFFADLPLSSLPIGQLGFPILVGYYLLLFGLTAFFALPAERRPRLSLPPIRSSAVLAAFGLLSIFTWRLVADRPDGQLHVTILDVGQGDATLVQTPNGRFALIDGGSSPMALSEALGRRMPLTDRRLDWLILAGNSEENLGGLAESIPRFKPRNVLLACPPNYGAYRYLIDQVTEAGIPIFEAQAGHTLDLGEDGLLEVTALGDQGAALLLTYGDFRLLLAPGADPQLMTELLGQHRIDAMTAVLLPDGGYEGVNPPELVEALQSQLALISVGAGNLRDLPSPAVLQSLQGITVLRTDLNGWIELKTDGKGLQMEVERNTP
jgi:competence protein ComEC